MTNDDLDALEAVLAAASLGEWYATDDAAHPNNARVKSKYRSHIAKVYADNLNDKQGRQDAAAIVALHNAAPALIALASRTEAAEREAARLQGALQLIAEESEDRMTRVCARAALGDA